MQIEPTRGLQFTLHLNTQAGTYPSCFAQHTCHPHCNRYHCNVDLGVTFLLPCCYTPLWRKVYGGGGGPMGFLESPYFLCASHASSIPCSSRGDSYWLICGKIWLQKSLSFWFYTWLHRKFLILTDDDDIILVCSAWRHYCGQIMSCAGITFFRCYYIWRHTVSVKCARKLF